MSTDTPVVTKLVDAVVNCDASEAPKLAKLYTSCSTSSSKGNVSAKLIPSASTLVKGIRPCVWTIA